MCRTKATVMVVSPNFASLEELGELLGRTYTVIGAADEVQRVAPYVQNVRPDVMILDVRDRELPKMSAERLARYSPETKLVFLGKAHSPNGYAVQTAAELTCAIPALLASGPTAHVMNEPVDTEPESTEMYLG
jgi:AmiR/NasT family two-component response regulator